MLLIDFLLKNLLLKKPIIEMLIIKKTCYLNIYYELFLLPIFFANNI